VRVIWSGDNRSTFEITEGFISLVKSRDRSLTLDHLERLTQSLSVPLGAFLLAVTKPYTKNLKEREQKLVSLAAKVMESCDATSAAIMNGPRSARRAS